MQNMYQQQAYRLVQGLHTVEIQSVYVQDHINGLPTDVLSDLTESLFKRRAGP